MSRKSLSLSPRWRVVAALGTIYLVWGSTYLAIRFADETIPPFLMAGARFLVAGGLLYVWMRARGTPRPSAPQWIASFVVGALLLALGNGGVVFAETLVPSGIAALLIGLVPIWMALLDWLRPGGPRPGLGVVLGLFLGLAGVALLASPGLTNGGRGLSTFGVVILLGSGIAWAAGSLYSRSGRLPTVPLLATATEMLAGGAVLVGMGSLTGEWGRLQTHTISTRSLVSLAYLVVVGSLVGFTLYIWLLRTTAPAIVSTYAYANPVVAVFLGWALAGEAVTGRTLVAAAVIIAGVVVITSFPARRATSHSAPDHTWPRDAPRCVHSSWHR